MRAVARALLALSLLASPAGATVPDDPAYIHQWGLHVISASRAWDLATGAGAVVAVLDTGVHAGHPDLRGRVLHGHDFVDDDADPRDENGHGTLIAGIVVAVRGNGIGISGVAPDARVLPVRVLSSDGRGSSDTVERGIRWAVAHHADVLNLSFAQDPVGDAPGSESGTLLRDPAVDRAIRDAAASGVTVVIASGNSEDGGKPETAYGADVPGVLVVGATTSGDRRAAYSNYGVGLDLVAPGGGSATNPSRAACNVRTGIIGTWWNQRRKHAAYGAGCGTSMAVAFVAGVAALLHEQGLSNIDIARRVLATARDVGPAGSDMETGVGRLDAAAALGARAESSRRGVRAAGQAAHPATPGLVSPAERASGERAVASGGPSRKPSSGRAPAVGIAAVLTAGVAIAHARLAAARRRSRSRSQAPA